MRTAFGTNGNVAPPTQTPARPADQQQTAEQMLLRRARQTVRDGYIGRAAKILWRTVTSCILTADAKKEKLQELHPAGAASGPIPLHGPPVLDIDMLQYSECVRRACSGAAAGRTGWTDELWAQALANVEVREALRIPLLDIANNEVGDSVARRLTGCRLAAIPKTTTDVRPVAVGETIVKHISSHILRTIEDVFAPVFRPIQLGVGTPGGAERIIHDVRERLAAGGNNSVLACIDFKNAFNCPLRSAMRMQLESRHDLYALYGMFNLAYAGPSALYFDDTTIMSSRGARQGDPLGAFLFGLVLQPILVTAAAQWPHVHIHAYMDDISITGTDARAVAEVFDFIVTRATTIGLEANMKKCEWFAQDRSHAPAGVIFRDSRSTAIKILGAYLGPDAEVKQAIRTAIITPLEQHFSRVRALDGQEGLLILLRSLAPRLGYILRTHKPELSKDVCADFDTYLLETLEFFADAKLNPSANVIRSLPTSLGGIGLIDPSTIASAAYDASLEAANVDISLAPADFREAMGAVRGQRSRTEEIHAGHLQALVDSDNDFYNLLNDAATSGTSEWLRTTPTWTAPLDHSETAGALRLRMGLAHRDITSLRCPGCHAEVALTRFSAHISGCTRILGANAAAGHAAFKRTMKTLAKHCGLNYDDSEPTDLEIIVCPACRLLIDADPQSVATHLTSCASGATADQLAQAKRRRPDIRFRPTSEEGTTIVVDVSMTSNVLHPVAANGQVPRAEGLHMVIQRERVKDTLYKERVESSGKEQFVPVVVTSLGAMTRTVEPVWNAFADEREGRMTSAEVRNAIAFGAIRARAQSMLNAEKRLGVHHALNRATRLASTATCAAHTNHDFVDAVQCPNGARYRSTVSVTTTKPITTRLLHALIGKPADTTFRGEVQEEPRLDERCDLQETVAGYRHAARAASLVPKTIGLISTTSSSAWSKSPHSIRLWARWVLYIVAVPNIAAMMCVIISCGLHSGALRYFLLDVPVWIGSAAFGSVMDILQTAWNIIKPDVVEVYEHVLEHHLSPFVEDATNKWLCAWTQLHDPFSLLFVVSVTTAFYLHRKDQLAPVISKLITSSLPITFAIIVGIAFIGYLLAAGTEVLQQAPHTVAAFSQQLVQYWWQSATGWIWSTSSTSTLQAAQRALPLDSTARIAGL